MATGEGCLNWGMSASDHIQDLARFVEASPSSFHAVAEAALRLDEAGFTQLHEADDWSAPRRKGAKGAGRHYVIRDGSVIAWIQPADATATTPFRILDAHTDS